MALKYFKKISAAKIGDSKGILIPFVRYGDQKNGIGLIALDDENPDQALVIADLNKMVADGNIGSVCISDEAEFELLKKKGTYQRSPQLSPGAYGNGLRLQADPNPFAPAARVEVAKPNAAQLAAETTMGAPLSNPEPATPQPRTKPAVGRPKIVTPE